MNASPPRYTVFAVRSQLEPPGDPARAALAAAGCAHAVNALQHVATGHYEGEHWLASFAVSLLTE